MINKNKKLLKNLNIFSNGSLLTTFNYNLLNKKSKPIFSEKDFKSFELSSKNKLFKMDNSSNISTNYRKNLFK